MNPKEFVRKIFKFFQKDSLIGLDIGSSSIKMAEFIQKEGKNPELMRTQAKEVSPDLLKEFLRDVNIGNSKFFVSFNHPRVALRQVTVPHMPLSELKEGIRLHAAHFFPFPIDNAELDFKILGEIEEKGTKKYRLLVATAPKKVVNETIEMLRRADIKPASLVPAPFALQQALSASLPGGETATAALDMGENLTELVIFLGKDIVFSRKIPVAGKDFTAALTAVLTSSAGRVQLSWEEAEKVKRRAGIPQDGEAGLVDGKISTTQILSMLRGPLEQIAAEIERCFGYTREEFGGDRVVSLRLFGGAVSFKGFAEALSSRLGVEVSVGEPPRFELASGAVLAGSSIMNFLPVEIRQRVQRTFKRASLQAVVVSVVMIAAFLYIGMKIQIANYKARTRAAGSELSGLAPQLKEVGFRRLGARFLKSEPYWEEVFGELSHVVPQEVYFTELNLSDGSLGIKGKIAFGEKEALLSEFMPALGKGVFYNATLVSTRQTAGGSEFELKCRVSS